MHWPFTLAGRYGAIKKKEPKLLNVLDLNDLGAVCRILHGFNPGTAA
jgi:hypothetical protein